MTKGSRYRRLVADGKCGICGGPRDADRSTCGECTSKRSGQVSRDAWRRRAERLSSQNLCVRCGGPNSSSTKNCADCLKEESNRAKALRFDVIHHYGGRCVCCGEKNLGFLSIDHPNDDGAVHRATVCGTGRAFYTWIKKNGYPTDLRVMCFNCNIGRSHFGGVCPHKLDL